MAKMWKFLVGVLVALLIVLLVAEFGLRWFIGSELRASFREQAAADGVTMEQDPTISFGPTPLVFSAVSRTVPNVEVTTPSTLQVTGQEILGQPGVHVTLTDLDISDTSDPVAAHMVTVTELPSEFLLATVQKAMREEGADGGLVQVSDLTASPDAGTLDVEFNGGMATLNLIPHPVDGVLTFEAAGGSLFGFALPAQVTALITQGLQQGLQEQAGDLRIDTFEVIDGGARLQLSGDNVALSQVADTQLPRR
ncbi:LmeA family phospholipid-binding protein [Corynebacterium nasicanis]|uniref:LmeA family phospholipid-binding protein n=1 Tax=Corynebacterium nasicanis TaxID=1448267 RepID=A0ABW1QFI8_9CORY